MADFALVESNVPRLLRMNEYVLAAANVEHPQRKVPVHSMHLMTEPERREIAVYDVGQDTTPVPSNKKVAGRELRYDTPSDTVKWHDVLVDLPVDERKAGMRANLTGRRDQQIWVGYSHDFGPAFGGVHDLDTRPDFKDGWTDYRNACQEQIDAGNGTAVMPVPIRTKAEVDLNVRANTGMAAMVGMRDREGTIILHERTLRDQIRAAADHAALDAIDINAGWPA